MLNPRYLVAGLALAVLLGAVAGISFVVGQRTSAPDESSTSDTTGEDDAGSMTGSMMNDGDMMGSQMVDSSDDEGKPFDLQFIDKMIPHHEGALMSSEHMISNSQRPELRQLYENIQKSQSEQIEQMKEWRKEWYPDAEKTSGMPSGMMGDGMMEGSMQGMMGGNTHDTMFLKMMIPHHQMAVDMSEEALSKAKHPELKDLARKIRDEQSSEIELMRGYLVAIQGPTSR